MEIQTAIPVKFSSTAVEEIKRLMSQEHFNKEEQLRIGVKGGGCSGMTYVLEFDTKQEKDIAFTFEGIPCIMNKGHEIYLDGMQIDWEPGLNSRGFVFVNPNASSTCGCGSSFGV